MRALIIAALVLAAGCGGGGSKNANAILTATPAAQAPTHLAVAGPASVAKNATFIVEVSAAQRLDDLYGSGFELRYDPALVEYVSVDTATSRLSTAMDAVGLRSGRQGTVVFGRTKQGAASGENVLGTIARFTFKALKDGRATIALAAPALIDAAGAEVSTSAPKGVDVTITP